MKPRYITLYATLLTVFSSSAQLFNFSLKTNNQQLIDDALDGAFIRINQSYELCDTVSDEHFGREGKDYFSVIPFIGIETEKGLLFPTATLTPWTYDKAFKEYEAQYKPLLTSSRVTRLNGKGEIETKCINRGDSIKHTLSILNDSVLCNSGLRVDTLAGEKEGWLIWISSTENFEANDSVRLTSIRKNIEVPIDGEHLSLDDPEIAETVYGGIYVTPQQTAVGQLTFMLTGIMVLNDHGWDLVFPFITSKSEAKALTPIGVSKPTDRMNKLKKKRK